ncbi:MAG: dTDP-4-dehydrorhamnose 3,5-epimerase [Deltaproteobacteria bacterium HGW-Deltaproteobacteria-14]|nr:MAG: dTDP-4-dehydrorhamnose 3,5-epimerase [Deltaproteobacteria bacterium HGW-Deltaproteobacteria-14]
MRITETALPEVWLLEHPVHADARGRFEELWRADDYAAAGLPPFVQDNHSTSLRGVIRGLHYQFPQIQGKLVSVLCGAIYDVAVDIRVGSPRFGRFVAVTLVAGDGRQLWVPPGFAHGFCALGETAHVVYKVTAPWRAAHERAIAWDDPALAIPWPVADPVVSERDRAAPRLADAGALPRCG